MGNAKARGTLAQRIATAKGNPPQIDTTETRRLAQFERVKKRLPDGTIENGVIRDQSGSQYRSRDGRNYVMDGKSLRRA